mgnify:CR=1 FL=1
MGNQIGPRQLELPPNRLLRDSAGSYAIANSHGVARAWEGSSVSAWVVALADDREGRQQTGSEGMSVRFLADLADMETIARKAALRAVARIGARSVPTARVPVIMHPDIAAAWLGEMIEAWSGESVMKQSSWLNRISNLMLGERHGYFGLV